MMNALVIFSRLIRNAAVSVTFALTLLVPTLVFSADQDFCWKDSYGRGVGTVPQRCKADEDRIGLLCYKKCPSGMKRFGFDCHSECPAGFRDDGLFCRKAEYGRGAGFPWQFGDPLNDSGMIKRCESKHGRGNCEKWGAVFYPKCQTGYTPFGCCICRPTVPDCGNLGLNAGIDLSCAKKVNVVGPVTGQCAAGEQEDAGLCYKTCSPGYQGVGPVCWGNAPQANQGGAGKPASNWVNCGMGAAKDSSTCASIVTDQVTSVGQIALFVATVGSGNAAKTITKAQKLAGWEKLKAAWGNLDKVKKAALFITAGNKIQGFTRDAVSLDQDVKNATTEEDWARLSAEIASMIDPTGVTDTIAAYTYPKCSKYFGLPR